MTKQDKYPIDTIFRNNIEQNISYEPENWQKIEKEIKARYFRKRVISYTKITVVLVAGIAALFAIKINTEKTGITSIEKTETSILLDNKDEGSTTPTLNDKIYTDKNTAVENEREAIMKTHFKTNKPGHNYSDKPGIHSSDEKSDLVKDKTTENEETIVNSDPVTPENNREMEISNLKYVDITIKPRWFNVNIQTPTINAWPDKNLERKKRKFATTFEFENLTSIYSKQKLGGLSQDELNYRNKYEDISKSNGHALNVMMQRGGVGLITGLGVNNLEITTNYLMDTNRFTVIKNITTHYILIKDSIPNSSRYYSRILIYDDTLKGVSEELKSRTDQNYFKWITIPLKISYQYPHNRLRFSVRAGVDFMWLYDYKGSFINSKINGVEKIGAAYHKPQQFNVNASTQVMAGYMLNRKVQVGGSLYYSRQLGSNFVNYKSRFQNLGYGYYIRYSL